MSDDFIPRQIFIVHESLWTAMQAWATEHNLHLGRIPDGFDEEGRVILKPEDDLGNTPTYAFMPKMVGDR